MTSSLATPATLTAWQAPEAHYLKVQELHLRKLFTEHPERGERMTAKAVTSCSNHHITDETLWLLLQLAEESGLKARLDAMVSGEERG